MLLMFTVVDYYHYSFGFIMHLDFLGKKINMENRKLHKYYTGLTKVYQHYLCFVKIFALIIQIYTAFVSDCPFHTEANLPSNNPDPKPAPTYQTTEFTISHLLDESWR